MHRPIRAFVTITTVIMTLFITPMAIAEKTSSSHLAMLSEVISLKKGEVLYVDFWASWCNPCRKSFPWMNAMQEKYAKQGFKIVAINVDHERALADEFLNSQPINFTIHYDPEGALAKAFQLQGMPSSFIIDDSGAIRFSHKGFFEDRTTQYEHEISSLIQPQGI